MLTRETGDENAPMYRVFWTWDHCTRWDDQGFWKGGMPGGESHRRAYFLQDYTRMVDFAAAHGINGIVIWGALRALRNGEEQLRELASYARGKGVRILPGCGTHAYGGVYYDPRPNLQVPDHPHPRSLYTWLQDHPELAAVGPDGKPYRQNPYWITACPSRPENMRWFLDSLQWLLSEFDVGGVQMETGDYSVCHCEQCKKHHPKDENQAFRVQDMLDIYAPAVEAARAVRPDAWVICETYSSFAPAVEEESPGFGSAMSEAQQEALTGLPEGAIVQWVLDKATRFPPSHRWDDGCRPPTAHNIGRIHAGCQWHEFGMEHWGVHEIGSLVRRARAGGLGGVSIFGEEPASSPPNEANYLVFSEFCGFGQANPECDMDLLFSQTLDPLYGGAGMAKHWQRIYVAGQCLAAARSLVRRERLRSSEALQAAMDEPKLLGEADLLAKANTMPSSERAAHTADLAAEAHSTASGLSGDPCRRWSWLESRLWRFEYLHRTDG